MAARMAGRNGYPKVNPFTPATVHENQWLLPGKWKKPRRIFVCSMGDLFHEAVSDVQIEMVLDYCRNFSQHTYQILTKRPERCLDFHFPTNVWLGATVESGEQLDRMSILSKSDAETIFLSCEPLLSDIPFGGGLFIYKVNWVIVGAETGPNKRLMQLDWARRIRDDCKAASVPFFFKKDSDGKGTLDGVEYHEFPEARK